MPQEGRPKRVGERSRKTGEERGAEVLEERAHKSRHTRWPADPASKPGFLFVLNESAIFYCLQ